MIQRAVTLRSSFQKGFTLIEILAALSIFAIMALGITATIRQTNSLTQKVKTRQETLLSGQIAMDRMQRDFEMAYNEILQNSPTIFKSQEGSQGAEVTFSYYETPMKTLILRRTPGIKLVQYRLEKMEDVSASRLVRVETSLTDADRIRDKKGQTIAEGVLEFKLEFYDFRNDRWEPVWDSTGRTQGGYFPKFVRVQIETVDYKMPSTEWKQKSLVFETTITLLNELDNF